LYAAAAAVGFAAISPEVLGATDSSGPCVAGRRPSAAREAALFERAPCVSWKRWYALVTNDAVSIDLAARMRAGVQ
jgi:hypothetical protein